MPDNREVEEAVSKAKGLLRELGYECDVTSGDLRRWFEADTLYDQDFGLDKVIAVPLIVVHELVEIDEVKKTGLQLGKRVILDNPDLVEAAHLKATEMEMRAALSVRNFEHVRARLANMRSWIEDPSVSPEYKERYSELHASISEELERRSGRDDA
ncbi:TPA: hypothetical protein HA259_09370 [Thermoplasmata archaeon]|nr:hypothetical protein [Thermoplasmata archaeon]